MPIPSPSNQEQKDKFIDRCMGDSVMNKEFPDEKQRYAVCQKKWTEKKN